MCALALSHVLLLWPHDCSPQNSVHVDSPSSNTGVGGHALLQDIFPMQGLNPGLLHCRRILYHLSHQRSSVSAIQQCKIGHNYAYIPSFLSLPPLAPALPSRSTERQAGLPVLYSNFSPAICFTHGSRYTYICHCLFLHSSHSRLPSLCPQVIFFLFCIISRSYWTTNQLAHSICISDGWGFSVEEPILSLILCSMLSNRTVFSPFCSTLAFLLAKEVTSPIDQRDYSHRMGISSYFLFSDWAPWHMGGSLVSRQGLNPCPLHWKCRVLTTEPPGKSLLLLQFFILMFGILLLLFEFLVCFLACLGFFLFLCLFLIEIRASQEALVVKNLPANAGDTRDVGSVPGRGRSPGGGNGYPLQYSSLTRSPMDWGAWRVTAHGVEKSGTRLSDWHYYSTKVDLQCCVQMFGTLDAKSIYFIVWGSSL